MTPPRQKFPSHAVAQRSAAAASLLKRTPTPQDFNMTHSKRRAFTTIELLTVIGIIAILMAMLFVALKYVKNSAATASTKTTLQNLNAMTAELDATNKLTVAPAVWYWHVPPTGQAITSIGTNPRSFSTTGTPAVTVSSDFWHYNFSTVQDATSIYWDPLAAPGDVQSETVASLTGPVSERFCSPAVLNTQLAMQMLASIPGNRSSLDRVSESSKMLPNYDPALKRNLLYDATTKLLKEDGTDATTNTIVYVHGIHVRYLNGGTTSFYLNISPFSNSGGTALPDATNWYDETQQPRGAPILLDGWNNPIIFVPASGLHLKSLNGTSKYDPAGTNQDFIKISPEGQVVNGTSGGPQNGINPKVIKIGKPFWASAGPDGDFTKGDDNIYSFEQ